MHVDGPVSLRDPVLSLALGTKLDDFRFRFSLFV